MGRNGRRPDDGCSGSCKKLGTQVPLTMLGGPGTIAAPPAAPHQGHFVAADLPHDAQRKPGRDQLPADPAAGRRAHGVSGLRRHPRPAGQRRFVVALHIAGFVFIVSLMLFVIGLRYPALDSRGICETSAMRATDWSLNVTSPLLLIDA